MNYFEFCKSLELEEDSDIPSITTYNSWEEWADNNTGSVGRLCLYHFKGIIKTSWRLMSVFYGDQVPAHIAYARAEDPRAKADRAHEYYWNRGGDEKRAAYYKKRKASIKQ
jgi:hypothetical protein